MPWAKSITCGDNGGYMQPMHAKAKSQDGHNPHLVTMDELHAHSDRGLFDVMNSAFGARRNPLMWIITTAGFNLHGVCYEQRTLATKVLERSVIAEHIFAIIFTIDTAADYGDDRKVGDDPYDASKWPKANPLWHASQPLRDEVAKRAIEAKASPSAEGEFKTKHLNMWLGAASAWLNVTQWIACSDDTLRLRDFAGLDCFIGTDLSDKDDITAVALAAIDTTGRLLLKTWFFVPAAVLARNTPSEKETIALYRRWHAAGHLIATPGDFIDQRRVERMIRRLKSVLMVRKVIGDQYAAWAVMASGLNEDFANGEEALRGHPAEEREEHDRPRQGSGGAGEGWSAPATPRRQPGDDVDGRQRGGRSAHRRLDPAQEGEADVAEQNRRYRRGHQRTGADAGTGRARVRSVRLPRQRDRRLRWRSSTAGSA